MVLGVGLAADQEAHRDEHGVRDAREPGDRVERLDRPLARDGMENPNDRDDREREHERGDDSKDLGFPERAGSEHAISCYLKEYIAAKARRDEVAGRAAMGLIEREAGLLRVTTPLWRDEVTRRQQIAVEADRRFTASS